MTCGSLDVPPNGMTEEQMEKKIGLIADHAYSLLAGFEFLHKGQIIKLVQLRNPWGKAADGTSREWRGKWSDYDQEN
jgi:hypothetical protein